MTGGAAGVFCALTARHYDTLMRTGYYPDESSLAIAVRTALSVPIAPIIGADDVRGADWSLCIPALVSATMLAGLYACYGRGPEFVAVGTACVVLLMLSCIDVRVCLLPDALTRPLLWLGLICAWAGIGITVQASVGGAVAGYVLLALPRILWCCVRRTEGVGGGDVKLLAAVGAWVGAMGVVHVLTVACIAGTVFAMFHQRRWRPSGAYPFGPFIALGGLAEFMVMSGVQSWF